MAARPSLLLSCLVSAAAAGYYYHYCGSWQQRCGQNSLRPLSSGGVITAPKSHHCDTGSIFYLIIYFVFFLLVILPFCMESLPCCEVFNSRAVNAARAFLNVWLQEATVKPKWSIKTKWWACGKWVANGLIGPNIEKTAYSFKLLAFSICWHNLEIILYSRMLPLVVMWGNSKEPHQVLSVTSCSHTMKTTIGGKKGD